MLIVEHDMGSCSHPHNCSNLPLMLGMSLWCDAATSAVSTQIGLLHRYSSLLNSVVCLTSALEEARSLLLIGAGARGVAPLRAALEWAPVQVGLDLIGLCAWSLFGCLRPSCAGWPCSIAGTLPEVGAEWLPATQQRSFASTGDKIISQRPHISCRCCT